MSLQLLFTPYNLKFKFAAGTSRGTLTEKQVWFVKVFDESNRSVFGIGEIATLARLSIDYLADFDEQLNKLAKSIGTHRLPSTEQEAYDLVHLLVPQSLPSLRFALEIALLDLINGGNREIFANNFFKGVLSIPINGLVWMGDGPFMKEQIDAKLKAGFSCLKMKIGAIDFDAECNLLRYIRKSYPPEKLTLRVDANGAFSTEDCLLKLKALEEFGLHSIEQPIMPRQPEAMNLICAKSRIPVALDEELIGVNGRNAKEKLLKEIEPAFIILKPGLLGGFYSTKEWIEIAERQNIGWWITSALESNVGLNAICQFTANYDVKMHQGLGTGQLFENNIPSPLNTNGDQISYHTDGYWDLSRLEF